MKHEVRKSTTIPYSASVMYELIKDVEKYPEFLPWCNKAQVHCCDDESMTASIAIAKGAMQHTLTTKNVLSAPNKIEMHLISGPFKHLFGSWQLNPVSDKHCQIDFHMEFMLSNRLLSMMLGPAFKHVANQMTDAFVNRAKECHG